MNFAEKARRMLSEYASDARQLQVKGTLEAFRLRSFMKEKDITDITEGLTKLVDHINELTSQCPVDFRSDDHKVDYLRKAVTEYQSWFRIPIQNITSQCYSFTKLVTTLHESIQNLRQIRLLMGESSSSNTEIVEDFDTYALRYGRNPRRNQRSWGKMRNGSHHPSSTAFKKV